MYVLAFAFPRIFHKMALCFESLSLILCFMNIYDWYSRQKPLYRRFPIQWQLVSYIQIESKNKNHHLGFNWFALFMDYYSNLYAIYSLDELGSICCHDASHFFEIC